MGRTIILLLMSCLALSSCTGRRLMSELNCLERDLDNNPDSVLNVINSVDKSRLKTGKLRAKYSLLYSMALDKSLIDTTDVSKIQPAVDYYKKKGSPDEKLKAYYYLGRVQFNSGDLNNAAISYALAERESFRASDEVAKGLLYMSFSDVYMHINNIDKEYEYKQKGIEAFSSCGDTRHLNLIEGVLADYNIRLQNWGKADSLFIESLHKAKNDTNAISSFLSNYAKMKVIQPNPDPEGAISLLSEKYNDYKVPLTLYDYAVYANALAICGDFDKADGIINELSNQGIDKSGFLAFFCANIELLRKNYPDAIEYLSESYKYDLKEINLSLSNSVAQTLQDYYTKEALEIKRDTRLFFLWGIIVFSMIIICLILYNQFLHNRNIKRQKELERLLILFEESNKMIKNENANLSSEASRYQEVAKSLRLKFVQTYKDKFSAIGELCRVYYSTKERKDKESVMYRRVEKLIGTINGDERLHALFREQINNDLNNVVSHLTKDLNITDRDEDRFICYVIAGFDSALISKILGISLSNVYTKKSRLKKRIQSIDSFYKDDYKTILMLGD